MVSGTQKPMPRHLLHFSFSVLCTLFFVPQAHAFDWELQLGLYNRLTVQANHVERMLRYDTAKGAFDTASYLRPKLDDVHYSFVVAAAVFVEPTSWLGVGLSVDSGLLQPSGKLPHSEEVTFPLSYKGQTLDQILPVTTTKDSRAALANGQRVADEARQTLFIRQAFLRFAAPETGWISSRVGRFTTEVGSSLVFNDSALGAELLLDFERLRDVPLRVSVQAVLPTRAWDQGLRSPLVELRVDYVFSAFLSLVESVGLVAAFYHDGDNNFGRLLEPSISEAAVNAGDAMQNGLYNYLVAYSLAAGAEAQANVGWIGINARKLMGDLLLTGTFMVELGKLRLRNPFWDVQQQIPSSMQPSALPKDEYLNLKTLGFALDLTASYQVSETLNVGGFLLYLSGDDNPYTPGASGQDSSYGSFLGVVPYMTHTNLFFSGGMNETFSGRQATTAGINGRGVVALGPNVSWEIIDDLTAGATAAVLLAPVASLNGGKFYGVELDLEGQWAVLQWLKVSAEYDLLAPGSFFAHKTVVHRFMLGLDLTYEL